MMEDVNNRSKDNPLKEEELWNLLLKDKRFAYIVFSDEPITSLSEIKYKNIAYRMLRVDKTAGLLQGIKTED